MPDSRGCLNVRESARALGVHENTIRNWASDGLLAVERLPGSGFIRVPIQEISRMRRVLMTKGPLGYGRYNDDPEHIGCPRAKSDMTPCVARDGTLACTGDSNTDEVCVGCGAKIGDLLKDLVAEVTRLDV